MTYAVFLTVGFVLSCSLLALYLGVGLPWNPPRITVFFQFAVSASIYGYLAAKNLFPEWTGWTLIAARVLVFGGLSAVTLAWLVLLLATLRRNRNHPEGD
jgi:hypothetical protein